MKKILLGLLILGSLYSNAQGLKNLDADFGINKFKLETSYSLHKNDLEYIGMKSQGIEGYKYKKTDIKEIFGIPVKEIGLCFFNNNLYSISINFGVLSKNQILILVENLKNRYDIPSIVQPNDKERVFVAEWVTGKTYLQATEYDCLSTLNSVIRCETELFIYSKNIKRKLPTD
jgi:hypothetical protein